MDLFKGFHKKQNHVVKHRDYENARTRSFPNLLSMFKSEDKKSLEDDISVERINHLNVQEGVNGHFNVTTPEKSSQPLGKIMSDEEQNVSKIDTFNAQIQDHQDLAKELYNAGNQEDAQKEQERAAELISQRNALIQNDENKKEKVDANNSKNDSEENSATTKSNSAPNILPKSQENELLKKEDIISEKRHSKIEKQMNDDHFNDVWENRAEILKNAYQKVQQHFNQRPDASKAEIEAFVLNQVPDELRPVIEANFKRVKSMTPEEQRLQIEKARRLNSNIQPDKESSDNNMINNQKEEKSSEISIFGNDSNESTTSKQDGNDSFSNENLQSSNFKQAEAKPSNERKNNSTITSVKGLIKDNIFNEESTLVINNRVLKTLIAIKINPDRVLLAYKNGSVKSIGNETLNGKSDFVLISDFNQFVSDLKGMLKDSSLVDSDFLVPNRFNIKQ